MMKIFLIKLLNNDELRDNEPMINHKENKGVTVCAEAVLRF